MFNILYAAYGPQGGAQAQSSGGGSSISLIIMIVAIFAVMYFLMIRPQQRQKKQHQEMLNKISKGDKVVTIGGIHGTVAGVKDNSVILKIADNVKVEVNRSAISQIVMSKAGKAQQQETKASKPKSEEEKEIKEDNKA